MISYLTSVRPLHCLTLQYNLHKLFTTNAKLNSNSKFDRILDKLKIVVNDDGTSSSDGLSSPPCKSRASARSDTINTEVVSKSLICCF
jgi:hypothetical protein